MMQNKMTPGQKIKWAIIEEAERYSLTGQVFPEVTVENVDEIFEEYEDALQDTIYEFRQGEVETNLPCDWSRHYECYAVASKMPDNTWVGWTYWYGGGKHGEPEAIDWMSEAHHLNCCEEERVVIVRTFEKVVDDEV